MRQEEIPTVKKTLIIFLLGILAGCLWFYNVNAYLQMNVINSYDASVKSDSSVKNDDKEAEQSDEGGATSSLPPSIENILDKVFILESSAGKRDSCHRQGKFNGFGFASNRICFDTQEEARNVVGEWFQKHLATKNLSQSLCYYQSGKALNDCHYYQKFLII